MRMLMLLLLSVSCGLSQSSFDQYVDSSAQRISADKAVSQYPDAAISGTPLFEAISREIVSLKKNQPAYFQTPEWPLIVAKSEATKLGISPVPPSPFTAIKLSPPQKESARKARSTYPDLYSDQSPLFVAITRAVERLKVSNPGFFDNQQWPFILAQIEANRLRITKTTPPSESEQAALDASWARAFAVYPDANKQGTKLFSALRTWISANQDTASPLYAEFFWPEVVVARVASEQGVVPNQKIYNILQDRSFLRSQSKYPILADKKSFLYETVIEKISEYEKTQPEIFLSPIWPEIIVDRQAQKLRINPSEFPATDEDIDRAVALDVHILDYLDLKYGFQYLDEDIPVGPLRARGVEAANRLGIENDSVQRAYLRAIYSGASKEEARVIRNDALQERAIHVQQQMAAAQLREIQQLRQEVNALRNEVPQKKVNYVNSW